MEYINSELDEVKRLCQSRVKGSRLITCVNGIVRVEISKTRMKTLTALCQFPKDYPQSPLLIELNSKTLGENLVKKLTLVCEDETKKLIGTTQVLRILEFLRKFIDENPLCCCSDEISEIKRILTSRDEIKLKQKTSSIHVIFKENEYEISTRIAVPEEYPNQRIGIESFDCNFPNNFKIFFVAHANEIARRCVEAPLNKRLQSVPFQIKPSLQPVISFLSQQIRRYPSENCGYCNFNCLPPSPNDAIENPNDNLYVERMYCGHLYHSKCMLDFLKTPPFDGGKKCKVCQQRMFHEKYQVTPEIAASRWAHQQAKERELEEAIDFLS